MEHQVVIRPMQLLAPLAAMEAQSMPWLSHRASKHHAARALRAKARIAKRKAKRRA